MVIHRTWPDLFGSASLFSFPLLPHPVHAELCCDYIGDSSRIDEDQPYKLYDGKVLGGSDPMRVYVTNISPWAHGRAHVGATMDMCKPHDFGALHAAYEQYTDVRHHLPFLRPKVGRCRLQDLLTALPVTYLH